MKFKTTIKTSIYQQPLHGLCSSSYVPILAAFPKSFFSSGTFGSTTGAGFSSAGGGTTGKQKLKKN